MIVICKFAHLLSPLAQHHFLSAACLLPDGLPVLPTLMVCRRRYYLSITSVLASLSTSMQVDNRTLCNPSRLYIIIAYHWSHLPSLESTIAPLSINKPTIVSFPFIAACDNGPRPILCFVSIFAPLSINRRTIASCLFVTAHSNGVR